MKVSAVIKGARTQLKKRIKALGAERDALRELADEYAELAGVADEALEGLHSAVDAISKYA